MEPQAEHDPPEAPGQGRPLSPPSLCDHGAAVMAQSLANMLSHAEGVRQSAETESVHQMRVWSRHSRAALEIFGCCFGGEDFQEMEREVKRMAGSLGEARDLDVMIEMLGKRADGLPPEQRPGIDSFIAGLRRQREAEQKLVIQAVARLQRYAPLRRLDRLVKDSAETTAPVPGRPVRGKKKHRHG